MRIIPPSRPLKDSHVHQPQRFSFTDFMGFDYFSIDAILAENQKIQCTFKNEIPGVGHIGGGSERDVRFAFVGLNKKPKKFADRSPKQNSNSNMACIHHHLLVCQLFH